ncbi:hypothetical protein H8F24_03390 [Synechococcus sp. CBW1002]|uniref:EF-hand domain-containing protein n=1 Tax=Synechococcus sp. CBW1002 TaxID=1353134 RepID=UPI0018CF1524|nr:hypothetical protein [Synechococcus sp. CBW1002]QPN60496.1 hypothetical protein H8F24_03390 [Synechococcus sp. CBW1002]
MPPALRLRPGRRQRRLAALMVGTAVALAAAVAPSPLLLPGPAQAREVAQQQRDLETYRQRLQELFRRLDRNGDQRLERSEVRGHAYIEKHFERLDRSGRGHLTPADFVPHRAAWQGERLRAMFLRADHNRNGRIERGEAKDLRWLQENFSQADRNGDGGVSLQELGELRRHRAGSASW